MTTRCSCRARSVTPPLTMSYLKSEGASEHYTCFLNPLPGFNSAFRYMSMEDMSSLIEMEKQRGVGSWFAFSDTTTPLFDIEEDLWEIYWNIKSSFVNGSEYSITVLDGNGAVVSEIPVGPERMIGSESLRQRTWPFQTWQYTRPRATGTYRPRKCLRHTQRQWALSAHPRFRRKPSQPAASWSTSRSECP